MTTRRPHDTRRAPLVALAVAAVAVAAVGCGSEATTTPSTGTSTSRSGAPASSTTAAPRKPAVEQKPDQNAPGPNETVANYIARNGIEETSVKKGDSGAPVLDLPVPAGWAPAGDDTPDWAYDAIVYTGPEAADYTPSVVALLSKLTGNVDPQQILAVASGELRNLPGYQPVVAGGPATLGAYPGYALSGTWQAEGETKLVAQKTVVIPAPDGVYVLQLNSDGLADQKQVVEAATATIDDDTRIGV